MQDVFRKPNVVEVSPEAFGTTTSIAMSVTPTLIASSTMVGVDHASSIPSTTSPSVSTTETRKDGDVDSDLEIGATTIETKVENTAPMVKSRLQKVAVTSGKAFVVTVPEDTFYDEEDMSNLRLELTDRDGLELKINSWLQFNAEKRQIYGL